MTRIKHIGIVDDDPITVFGIRKMLKSTIKCDHIDTYKNGKVAFDDICKKLKENQALPDIIFLDINMPIMDGWQFLEAFLELPIKNKVRINIVTSSIDPYDLEQWESFKNRTHHLITFNNKPIRPQEIAQITKVA